MEDGKHKSPFFLDESRRMLYQRHYVFHVHHGHGAYHRIEISRELLQVVFSGCIDDLVFNMLSRLRFGNLYHLFREVCRRYISSGFSHLPGELPVSARDIEYLLPGLDVQQFQLSRFNQDLVKEVPRVEFSSKSRVQ